MYTYTEYGLVAFCAVRWVQGEVVRLTVWSTVFLKEITIAKFTLTLRANKMLRMPNTSQSGYHLRDMERRCIFKITIVTEMRIAHKYSTPSTVLFLIHFLQAFKKKISSKLWIIPKTYENWKNKYEKTI